MYCIYGRIVYSVPIKFELLNAILLDIRSDEQWLMQGNLLTTYLAMVSTPLYVFSLTMQPSFLFINYSFTPTNSKTTLTILIFEMPKRPTPFVSWGHFSLLILTISFFIYCVWLLSESMFADQRSCNTQITLVRVYFP